MYNTAVWPQIVKVSTSGPVFHCGVKYSLLAVTGFTFIQSLAEPSHQCQGQQTQCIGGWEWVCGTTPRLPAQGCWGSDPNRSIDMYRHYCPSPNMQHTFTVILISSVHATCMLYIASRGWRDATKTVNVSFACSSGQKESARPIPLSLT